MEPFIRRAVIALLCLSLPAIPVGTAHATDTQDNHIHIEFDAFSRADGLSLTITTKGDEDGRTTFSNQACSNRKGARCYIEDFHASVVGKPAPVIRDASGWTVSHASAAELSISYRLSPSGDTMIDTGLGDQTRPIVDGDAFQLMGSTALLLPTGHPASQVLDFEVDATRVVAPERFVSSFGPGNEIRTTATRYQIDKSLFMGGDLALDIVDAPNGSHLGIAASGLDSTVDEERLRKDAIAIAQSARSFFNDTQPWYLISVRGGKRRNPAVHIGGGTGKTNAFAMFVRSDLDFDDSVQREQFRWVLAHEYFHQWNGLTLRVAPSPSGQGDDISVYWFSEGVTEFYAMRLLTRAGLQTSARSLTVLNFKLARYDANSKRDLSAEEAAKLFWSPDRDGEQIPYLRGYLAAWFADLAIQRASGGKRGLDDAMRDLVQRAKDGPGFRATTKNLVAALGKNMSSADARQLERFVTDGGQAPISQNSLAPCLMGKREPVSGRETLQFHFADPVGEACFQH